MAFWNKKKDKTEEENTAAQTTEASAGEAQEEESTLDIVKATMEQAKEELHAERQAAAEDAARTENQSAVNQMPTPEEIRHAQEIIARAQAAQANQIPTGAKVGVNAPVNTSNLKAVIAQFVQAKTQDNLKLIIDCLQKPGTLVCVPAQIITSKENQEKLKQGGEVKLEGPLKINPVLLTDNKGKKVFPIFSGEDTIPDNIKKNTPKVNMPLGQCLNIMRGMKDVSTFALDPFTANITIGVNIQQNNPNTK